MNSGNEQFSLKATPGDSLITRLSSPAELNIYSLVLSAADITHRIKFITSEHIEIYVAEEFALKAKYELAAYVCENEPPSLHVEEIFAPTFKAMAFVITAMLILIFGVTGDWQQGSPWFSAGAGDSTAILQDGEFYRLVTPLTLHANIVHLMSNSIAGTILIHFFLAITGNGVGLMAILVTATCANLINVMVHGPGHLFVGFSTAVFAVIGMLCTINFVDKTKQLGPNFFMPLMAGLALLAFLGSSGEQTDLGGHLFGLICGLIGGNFVRFSWFTTLRSSLFWQTCLAIITFFCVTFCWILGFKG